MATITSEKLQEDLLAGLFSGYAPTAFLAENLPGPAQRLQVEGTRSTSQRALIAAQLYNAHPAPQLHLLPDRETALYFQTDLETLVERKTVRLFPSAFRHEGDFTSYDNNLVAERTEVLNSLRDPRPQVIVTYPEALLQKVFDSSTLSKNIFEVATGDEFDLDFVIEFLTSYHFERSDFVYEAGTFSLRGAIVDIYSYAGELPVRIELDEDKVRGIRLFDPETQLSVRKLSRFSIIPDLAQASDTQSRLINFLQYIPETTCVFLTESRALDEKLQSLTDKLEKVVASASKILEEKDLTHLPKPDEFSLPGQVLHLLEKFTAVDWGTSPIFKPQKTFEVQAAPQPEFNKNFDLLAATLTEYNAKGYQILICSDQPKQIERLYSIFEDIGAKKAQFKPWYRALHEGWIDHHTKTCVLTEHQIFGRYHRYTSRKRYNKSTQLSLKELYELKPGDFVTHLDHGVGIFSGLEKLDVGGQTQEAIRLKYKGGDLLYVPIHSLHKISRFVGQEGKPPKMNKLGTGTWENMKSKAKAQVKDIARDLIHLYAQRKAQRGFQFSPDSYLQAELEASFMYEDTPDQAKSTEDVKRDMESPSPMDRLVCGDVGFGKTEVAIRAAFKAVADSKQVAILVPTTVLSLQHYKTFRKRMENLPANIEFISRFKPAAAQKEVIRNLAEGKIDIVIGTHRLLSKDVKFKDLGLLIIDEEQKFGVAAKEKLRALKANVDTLTLTATPIPRTLQFSLMGARDLSLINTPPPNRQPVQTRIEVYNTQLIKEAIEFEVSRGGQVFFVHNRIKDIFEVGDLVRALVPQAKVAVAHAQMEATKLEELMLNFIDGYYDVLVSTNIVESGLDIPNANTMLINNAQNFGLSDLYQLRGRVGRSNRKAYCYMLTPPFSVLTPEARRRLAAIEEHTDLGSGFMIAMKDMDIRGAGNLLGAEQSGFIAEIGYEMFQKILQEAMRELKHDEFSDLFHDEPPLPVEDVQIETDLALHIPDAYVSSTHERLSLYTRINEVKGEEELSAIEQELEDRFGELPPPTRDLLNLVRVKWLLKEMQVDKAAIKRTKLRAFFSSQVSETLYQSPIFERIILFVQKNPQRARLQSQPDGQMTLTLSEVRTAGQILHFLREMVG